LRRPASSSSPGSRNWRPSAEALRVTEERDGELIDAGEVRFGFAGKGLWSVLDPLREGGASRDGVVPVRSEIMVKLKFFGRHKGGAIRDGVVVHSA
jgi:hypothetical protein